MEQQRRKSDMLNLADGLKSINFDIENKVFEINGVNIGKDCMDIDISFHHGRWAVHFGFDVKEIFDTSGRHTF